MGQFIKYRYKQLFMGCLALSLIALSGCERSEDVSEQDSQTVTQQTTSQENDKTLPTLTQGDSILEVQDDLVLTSLQTGASGPLADFLGKPLVLGIWVTWCPHCRSELLVVKDLLEKKPEANIVMVNLSKDAQEEKETRAFLKEEGLEDLPIYFGDPQLFKETFHVEAYPTTLFINRDGTIVQKKEGTFTLPEVQSFL